ncbi:hypothetical protein [Lutibacter sp.]|uniref:hypothetical protein n=1 Tax=Lutibacter sp. TaxID=1925666 RepID=UPI003568D6B7
MKKLIKTIQTFFISILSYNKYLKFYFINKKLKKAVTNKTKERLKLRYEITTLIKKYTKWDKDNVSKYIPLDEKTKAEIRFQVDLKFGKQMKALNVKLNSKLQVV